MQIDVSPDGSATVIALAGEVTAQTAPQAQAAILPLAGPGCKLVLDLTGVPFMSSAGLRMLLMVFRTVAGKGGKVVLAGLAEEIRSTMSLTGFLDFFECNPTRAAAVAALG